MLQSATLSSKPTHARKRTQLGMTLIETMLVLMIGVLVIAGVVVLAQSVLGSMKVNRSKQVLVQIASGIQTSFSSSSPARTPYEGLDLSEGGLGRFSFVPKDLVTGKQVYLPLGDGKTAEVTVDYIHSGACFKIKISDSGRACGELVLTDFGNNNLCDDNGKPAMGRDGEMVGTIDGDGVVGNKRGSAFFVGALRQCERNVEIEWRHV